MRDILNIHQQSMQRDKSHLSLHHPQKIPALPLSKCPRAKSRKHLCPQGIQKPSPYLTNTPPPLYKLHQCTQLLQSLHLL